MERQGRAPLLQEGGGERWVSNLRTINVWAVAWNDTAVVCLCSIRIDLANHVTYMSILSKHDSVRTPHLI